MKINEAQDKIKELLGDIEHPDIFVSLLELSNVYEIDLEKELKQKVRVECRANLSVRFRKAKRV